MVQMSRTLTGVISKRHGIVTREQLIGDGFSHREIDRWTQRQLFVRVHNGVYRVATSPDTFHARCVAACAADPEVVIAGPAAARLWGFRHVWRTEQPIVLVAHDRTPLARNVTLRRTNVLDDEDRVQRGDGICVASPPARGSTARAISTTSTSNG